MPSYTEFIKLLMSNNIEMYDYQKRIAYYKLNNLLLEQKGGGYSNGEKLKNLNKFQLENIIISLNQNRFDLVRYLLDL